LIHDYGDSKPLAGDDMSGLSKMWRSFFGGGDE